MALRVLFIPADLRLTGAGCVDSYTILEKEKVKEIGRGHFASVLLARHNGEAVVLKISSTYCRRL